MRTLITYALLGFISIQTYTQTYNPEIDKNEIKEHINYLASEELAGRKPGTAGDKAAAKYIRDKFEEAGLKLLGKDGYQYFEITSAIELGENNKLTLGDAKYELKKDFIPLSFSGNSSVNAEVVFVGYGFSIKEDTIDWDDYKGIDVEGKWVMVLRADPDLDNPHSPFARYSRDRYKVMNALDHGAAGILLVNSVDFDKQDALAKLKPIQGIAPAKIPVVQIKRNIANEILKSQNDSIEGLEQQLNENVSNSFETGTKLQASTEVNQIKSNTMNVIGYLEGTSNTDEYIVVGAHYDHLGMGGGSSRAPDTVAVHYGADDNASGVGLVIELAQKAAKNRPERSVLFIAFGAEEMGLLGSRHYVSNPVLDKDKAKAMFNLDMVGRLNEEKSIVISGTGTAAETDSLLTVGMYNDELNLVKSPGGTGPSDHSSFYTEGIPVLFFSTGVHDQYHTPNDKAEFINYEGTEVVGNQIFDLLILYGKEAQVLSYRQSGSKQGTSMRRRMKVTMGIIPDYGSEIEGLGVGGVRTDGPAELGGMQKGDIIIGIDGKPITNIYDYMYRMAEFSTGQRITVEVLRNEEKKLLIIEL